jgi:endoglucanase
MQNQDWDRPMPPQSPAPNSPSQIQVTDDGMYLKDGLNTVFFKWLEVLSIVSEEHQSLVISLKRRVLVRESLKAFEHDLKPYGFIRLNRQVIFNLRYVKRFIAGANPKLISVQGESYPITRRRKIAVRRDYEEFLACEKEREVKAESRLFSFRSRVSCSHDIRDGKLWVNPSSKVNQFLSSCPDLKGESRDIIRLIAQTSTATWLGEWNENIYSDVKCILQQAESTGSIPVLAIYRLFLRDETKGRAPTLAQVLGYKRWIQQLAQGLEHHRAILILEPNALSMIDESMPREWQEFYFDALRFAVATLSRLPQALVYLDAGHAAWRKPVEMAILLARCGIDFVQGFAVNVSHFIDTNLSHAYGSEISSLLGGKPFVIDTSRNGVGIRDPENWCNPTGVGLGALPRLNPRLPRVDAFLWVKPPGESDGSCFADQPSDGTWWVKHALELGQHSRLQI